MENRILPLLGKHRNRGAFCRNAALAVAIAVGLPRLSCADVITLNDGTQQTGLVTDNKPGSPKVTIRTTAGEISLPREKVANIEIESPSASQTRLGDAYFAADNLKSAADAYRKALELDAENADAKAKLEQLEMALSAERRTTQQMDTARVEEALARVRKLAQNKKYEEADSLLKSLNMGFGTSKAPDVRRAYADTYIAWANDRLDRQDPGGAAEKLQFALRLDPTNQVARQKLIQAWEGDPTKIKEIAEFYKDSKDPAEQMKRAEALFRLRQYEDALPIYLNFVNDDRFGTQLARDRIRLMFTSITNQYQQAGKYEDALKWYKAFLEYSPTEDPSPIGRLQYMVQRSKTNMNDPQARVQLAQYAEQLGMADTAKREYMNILQMAPNQPQALEAERRYAAADLEDARQFYAQGQYLLASQKAKTTASTYANLQDVVREAQELQTRANLEQAKVQQSKQQQAVLLAERGDRYYEQGLSYLSAMLSSDLNTKVRVVSPKEEAKKYFLWAIYAYQNAMQIDPSLGDPTSYDLNRRISDASAKYWTLANPYTSPLPRRDNDLSKTIVPSRRP